MCDPNGLFQAKPSPKLDVSMSDAELSGTPTIKAYQSFVLVEGKADGDYYSKILTAAEARAYKATSATLQAIVARKAARQRERLTIAAPPVGWTKLLAMVSSPAELEANLGDCDEGYARLLERLGEREARRWYKWAVLRTTMKMAVRAIRTAVGLDDLLKLFGM